LFHLFVACHIFGKEHQDYFDIFSIFQWHTKIKNSTIPEEGVGCMHILIVEDEQNLAHILRRVLTSHHYVVDLVYDGAEALDYIAGNMYELILLDLLLPHLDGISLCKQIRAEGIMTPVLMLTAKSSVEDRIHGLNIGADDYLIKPFVMGELLARIQALLRRRDQVFQESTELRISDLTLDLLRHEVHRGTHNIELTVREFTLLEYLMRHPKQVLTRAQILDHVWGYDIDTVSNVVDNYVYFLREKIDRDFPNKLIKTVRGIGYKIGE
jgi:DNA-binding response OmpR family regulator